MVGADIGSAVVSKLSLQTLHDRLSSFFLFPGWYCSSYYPTALVAFSRPDGEALEVLCSRTIFHDKYENPPEEDSGTKSSI